MKKKYVTIILSFSLILPVIAGGLFLPGLFLTQNSENMSGEMKTVPAEYYSSHGTAVSRVASMQLSEYEKIRLISGAWDSITTESSSEKNNDSSFSVVKKAEDNLNKLYQNDLYPTSFYPIAANWYAWEATYYSSVDTTFHTYTANYWLIKLSKYDGTEKHVILMTEDGTVLFAEATIPVIEKHLVDVTINYKKLPYVNDHLSSCTRLSSLTPLPSYQGVRFPDKKSCIGVVTVGSEWIRDKEMLDKYYNIASSAVEFYYVYQARDRINGMERYSIGMIPYEG